MWRRIKDKQCFTSGGVSVVAVGFICFLGGLCSLGNNHMNFVKDRLKRHFGLTGIASYNERIK